MHVGQVLGTQSILPGGLGGTGTRPDFAPDKSAAGTGFAALLAGSPKPKDGVAPMSASYHESVNSRASAFALGDHAAPALFGLLPDALETHHSTDVAALEDIDVPAIESMPAPVVVPEAAPVPVGDPEAAPVLAPVGVPEAAPVLAPVVVPEAAPVVAPDGRSATSLPWSAPAVPYAAAQAKPQLTPPISLATPLAADPTGASPIDSAAAGATESRLPGMTADSAVPAGLPSTATPDQPARTPGLMSAADHMKPAADSGTEGVRVPTTHSHGTPSSESAAYSRPAFDAAKPVIDTGATMKTQAAHPAAVLAALTDMADEGLESAPMEPAPDPSAAQAVRHVEAALTEPVTSAPFAAQNPAAPAALALTAPPVVSGGDPSGGQLPNQQTPGDQGPNPQAAAAGGQSRQEMTGPRPGGFGGAVQSALAQLDAMSEPVDGRGARLPSQSASIRAQVLEQVGRQLSGTGTQDRMSIRLLPEHLGEVEVQFHAEKDRLTVVLRASSPEAEQALRGNARELAESIVDRSARFQHVEVRVDMRDGADARSGKQQDQKQDAKQDGRQEQRRDTRDGDRERRPPGQDEGRAAWARAWSGLTQED